MYLALHDPLSADDVRDDLRSCLQEQALSDEGLGGLADMACAARSILETRYEALAGVRARLAMTMTRDEAARLCATMPADRALLERLDARVEELAAGYEAASAARQPRGALTWLGALDLAVDQEDPGRGIEGWRTGAFLRSGRAIWEAWTTHKREASDPSHPKCRARLLREFAEMAVN